MTDWLWHGAQDLLHAGIVNGLFAAVLCVPALAASALLRGRWPSLRRALWMLVLLRLVLPPRLSHPWSLGALVGFWPTAGAWSEDGGAGMPRADVANAGRYARTGVSGSTTSPWVGLVILCWAAGVVGLVAVDVRCLRACRRLVGRATPVSDPWVSSRVASWRDRLGIRAPVRVVTGQVDVSPFTMGLLRPVIFVPSRLLEPLRRQALGSALAHELAHVARRDALGLRVERTIGRLYFFHPVAWLAGWHLQQGREQLADTLVVSRGLVERRAFARGLLDVLQLGLQGVEAPTLRTTEGRIKVRILSILRAGKDRPRVAVGAAVVTGLFLVPLASGSSEEASHAPAGADATGSPASEAAGFAFDNPLPGGRLTMPYGQMTHPIRRTPYFHRGVDLAAPDGAEVRAAADGVVETATTAYKANPESGTVVVIDHGRGLKTLYAHLGVLMSHDGQKVRRGEVVARVGMSGVTTGPHVHFEVWRDGQQIDPASIVAGLAQAGR